MVFKLMQLKNLPSIKNILTFQFLTICKLILQFNCANKYINLLEDMTGLGHVLMAVADSIHIIMLVQDRY